MMQLLMEYRADPTLTSLDGGSKKRAWRGNLATYHLTLHFPNQACDPSTAFPCSNPASFSKLTKRTRIMPTSLPPPRVRHPLQTSNRPKPNSSCSKRSKTANCNTAATILWRRSGGGGDTVESIRPPFSKSTSPHTSQTLAPPRAHCRPRGAHPVGFSRDPPPPQRLARPRPSFGLSLSRLLRRRQDRDSQKDCRGV